MPRRKALGIDVFRVLKQAVWGARYQTYREEKSNARDLGTVRLDQTTSEKIPTTQQAQAAVGFPTVCR